MGPAAARPPPRKRVRKRKRRAVSESSSSPSSSDSDSNDDVQQKPPQAVSKPVIPPPEESSSSSSSSSESSSLESDSELEPASTSSTRKTATDPKPRQVPRRNSPSPSPPLAEIPSFINSSDPATRESEEQLLKAKFRKFWMASVADGFKDDLEEIRKEPNLGPSRLALLIDSLASGADVFSSSSNKGQDVNEMEVVLE